MEGLEACQNLVQFDVPADERLENWVAVRASELALEAIARIRLSQRFAASVHFAGADFGRCFQSNVIHAEIPVVRVKFGGALQLGK